MPSKKRRRIIKVNSRKNSTCGSAQLKELDWSNWFTDSGSMYWPRPVNRTIPYCYLHVDHKKGVSYGGTHRVHCRAGDNVRLMLKNGELYWILDPNEPQHGVAD